MTKIFTFVVALMTFGAFHIGLLHGDPLPIQEAATGSDDSRVWSVFFTAPTDFEHASPGDSFRFKKQNADTFVFEPLSQLRARWGYIAGTTYSTVLNRIDEHRACGDVVIPAHTPSTHRIRVRHAGQNLLIVQFLPAGAACTETLTHGGTAHAEN